MKLQILRTLTASLSVAVVFTGCDGLGKMIKKQKDISYSATPNPIEMHGDSIQFSVSGKFSPKLFGKKITLTITPVIKYAGGEKALKVVVLQGEKATGTGQTISNEKGGTFAYTSDKFLYEPGMKVAKVELRGKGTVKKKEKDFAPVEIADGTIITPLLVRNDEKGIYGKDAFVKLVPMNQETHVYYTISSAAVRPAEMKSEEMKNINKFISENINSPWYEFKGIDVSAYASPDGETEKNTHLAGDRAKSGSEAMLSEFRKNKNKDNKFGKEKDQYKVGTTGEDWDGFKKLMEESALADKDLILRVLTMYTDPNQRRTEIKNLSKTYKELAEKILPKLRRSIIIVNVDKKSRTDEMISKLCTSYPDSLSVEELLYGANLATDINTKTQIYGAAEKKYGTDWRTSNNLGVALLVQNKVSEAGEAFKRAETNAAGNPILMNNLGIIEAKAGNRPAAMALYDKANGAGNEVGYNKGILQVRNGKYSDAASSFGEYKSFNKALAQMLSGSPDAVNATIDAGSEKDMALSFYLKAVTAARKSSTADVITNLKTAIEKDGTLKAAAKDDAEFIKLKADAGFTALIN